MAVLHGFRRVSPTQERCFNIETSSPLTAEELARLRWVLAETFQPTEFDWESLLTGVTGQFIEIGPRLSFATAKSTNAVAICHAIGLTKVTRVETSRRTLLSAHADLQEFVRTHHDRMSECVYPAALTTFAADIRPESVRFVPVLTEGEAALRRINAELGLGMDDADIAHYLHLFRDIEQCNPTDVELFQLGNGMSEHSRHPFFKGIQVIDGEIMPFSLLEIIQSALRKNRGNSVIAFCDNSSAIRGYKVWTIVPQNPGQSSSFVKVRVTYDPTLTAETHNHPSRVEPVEGAATGALGCRRDGTDTGRGSLGIARTVGFCVANLHIPGYPIPGEDDGSFRYPENFPSPLQVLLGMVKGAWDAGNQLGEPVICGITRSFDLRLPSGERSGWVKPVMFTGGVGQLDRRHHTKDEPQRGMLIVRLGGPAYNVGFGGGAASSMAGGAQSAELDFKSVQRGNAQMENNCGRVIRACVEQGDLNPLCAIHDQGAGGPANVLTELVHPAGGRISLRKISLGDTTMPDIAIWGAEFQESHGLLIWPDRLPELLQICLRERVPCDVVGEVTGDGRITVYGTSGEAPIVDLPLEHILGKVPRKTFTDATASKAFRPLEIPTDATLLDVLRKVFAQLSVGSKEGLLNRVDRSVTGLVAQQQYCGSVQLPIADVAVVAQSHFGVTGIATSIGEQPIKMLVSEAAGARMAVGEMLTNLAAAIISSLGDVKTSVNWMWAAKHPGEGAALYRAACAAVNLIIELDAAQPDGGKDSLSMSAKVGQEVVKAPGQMIVSGYVTMPDIRRKLTPDLKNPGNSRLMWIDLGWGKSRTGGSALAQAHGQIGDTSPDIDAKTLAAGFRAMQTLQRRGLISAIHDISDGGLITAVLEMAFAGNCGVDVFLCGPDKEQSWAAALFSEELGWVIEYDPKDYLKIQSILRRDGLTECAHDIARTTTNDRVTVRFNGALLLGAEMTDLRACWRETSFQLAALVADLACVKTERENTRYHAGFQYEATFDYGWTKADLRLLSRKRKPKVAIIREEGTNGEREMTSAFFLAGFEPWDVTMSDWIAGGFDPRQFSGIVFPGGFSFADVFDSAKGWAAVMRFNPRVADDFAAFIARPDTFVLGVCNGCQLMALLGVVPWQGIPDALQPRFIRNASGVFESRWVNLRIADSNSIFLQGMAGSNLGCWVAHGEGQFYCPKPSMLGDLAAQGLTPVFYDDDGLGKSLDDMSYPFNPNGSPDGIAGLISPDGRCLALMPHPERCFLPWQWPHWTRNLPSGKVAPWFQIFRNARRWVAQS